ncbi:MAG: cyclic nucleotide-binding and patatin-like phospholipase domain-containing protein [Gemmatimonadaceae bacterium]
MRDGVSSILAASPLFSTLQSDALDEMSRAVEHVRLSGGATLFHQGATADCLYVVASGRLRVSVSTNDGGERTLGEVGAGDAVGEMSILTGEPRSATVRALRDSEVLRLDASAFNHMIANHPAMMMQVSKCIIDRYRAAISPRGSGHGSVPRTIAIVPTNHRVPLSEFTKRLQMAFASTGSVVRLTSDSVNRDLGPDMAQTPPDHARSGELAEWLMRHEEQNAVVLYEADLVHSQWTNRCIRQADRVLIVGQSGDSAELGPIEVAMRREGTEHGGVGRELVLLHPERKNLYLGTDEWLKLRTVDRHHHVVLGGASDYARLSRMYSGTATAVVLGGGGARCFAQIGALRALAEAGIPIDLIGGTSMGAYLAAQQAYGMEPDRMEEFNTYVWSKLKPLSEYTLPFVGLTSPMKFFKATRELFGEANIEDFGIPFFCCSSNITKAKLMVFDRGTIWFSLCASIAVPGIGPPLLLQGDLLVDGAVLDNLPVDVMRQRFDGNIVAVDVSPVEDVRADPVYKICPSSWQFLGNRMNPFAERIKIPGIFEILGRCATLTSVQQTDALRRQADLYVHPPTEPFSMFDWGKVSELSRVGYSTAVAALQQWRAGGAAKDRNVDQLLRVSSTVELSGLTL